MIIIPGPSVDRKFFAVKFWNLKHLWSNRKKTSWSQVNILFDFFVFLVMKTKTFGINPIFMAFNFHQKNYVILKSNYSKNIVYVLKLSSIF